MEIATTGLDDGSPSEFQSKHGHSPRLEAAPDLLRCIYESSRNLGSAKTKEDVVKFNTAAGSDETTSYQSNSQPTANYHNPQHQYSDPYASQHPFSQSNHHPPSFLAGGSVSAYVPSPLSVMSSALMTTHVSSNFNSYPSSMSQQSFGPSPDRSSFGPIYHHASNHYQNQISSQPYNKFKSSNSRTPKAQKPSSIACNATPVDRMEGDELEAGGLESLVGGAPVNLVNFNLTNHLHSLNGNGSSLSSSAFNQPHLAKNGYNTQHAIGSGGNLYETLTNNALVMGQTAHGPADLLLR